MEPESRNTIATAAVWGARGFAGSHVCAAVENAGWSVRRLNRTELPFGAGEAAMAKALEGAGIAFHCAGKLEETDIAGYAAASGRFAAACALAGVRHLVYLSTVAVYGQTRGGMLGTDAPLLGTGDYASSRIEAELAIQAALSGTGCRWKIARVPMLVGRDMPGTVLRRIATLARWGVFPHPGPADACVALLGVRRLAALLARLDLSRDEVLQFADHLRWADIARRAGELHSRRVLRIRLPALGGRFAPFASTTRYADDSARVARDGLPATAPDLDEALRPG